MRPSLQLKTLTEDSSVAQDDNWMLSYIDVFILITTLFLMLLVMNKNSFGTTDILSDPLANYTPASTLTEQDATARIDAINNLPPTAAGKTDLSREGGSASSLALHMQLEETLENHGLENHVSLTHESDRTRLEIESRVLFDSGDAFLTRPGEAVLEKLLPLLETVGGEIVIEGHTDNKPINTTRFPSNWSLAAARATEVLQFFVTEGFDEQRFRAVSYGDTQPIASNDSESGRRKNRRVTLVLEARSGQEVIEVSL